MRKTIFENEKYYHVYNRGVDKRKIFLDDFDYLRFLESIKEFNDIEPVYSLYLHRKLGRGLASTAVEAKPLRMGESRGSDLASRGPASTNVDAGPLRKPLVEVVCYSLLQNHFHLLLKQKRDGGISEFMKRLGGGYTGYINKKIARSGSLFQGTFKAVKIDSDNQLDYLIAYILGNSEIHKIEKYDKYKWNNLLYLEIPETPLKNIVEANFGSKNEFNKYLKDVIINSSEIKEDKKKYVLEV